MAPPARHRRWIAPALLLLLLVAGAAVWAQTRDAFQRVWLPLTAQWVGGTWSAEEGRLGLGGSLEIDGLHFDVPGLAQGEVATLRLKLNPWACFRQGVAVVETLSISGANLALREKDPEAGAEAEARASDGSFAAFEWPEIAKARVEDVQIRTGEGTAALVLGPMTIHVDDLAFPERGALSLEVPFARGVEGEIHRGQLIASLTLSPEDSDAEASAFDGNLELSLDSHPRSPIVLGVRGQGRTDGESVELSAFDLDLLAKENRLLEVRGSGALLPEAQLDAQLVFGRVGLLARLLGVSSPAARIAGDVHVEGGLDEWIFEPSLTVDELRGAEDASSPFSESLRIGGRLTWQRQERMLLLAPLELAGVSAAGLGALMVEGSLQPGQGAELVLTAKAFDLLPWLRLAVGNDDVPLVRGPISGSAALQQAKGETVVETDLVLTVVSPPGDTGEVAPGIPLRVELQHRQTAGKSGPFEGDATLHGPGASGEAGTARLTWERESIEERAELRLRGDLPDFDLTSLATFWESVRGEEPDSDAEAPASIEPAAAQDVSPKDRLDLEVSIGAIQFRELTVHGGRVRAQLGGESWEVRVEALGLADGLVDLEAYGGPHGGGERIGWDLVAADVEVAPLLAALFPGGERQLSGRLSVISRAEGVAAPGQDLVTAPDGNISFDLSEGRASGLDVQQELTQVAEMTQFAVIDYDEVEGDYPIENGRVLIDELRLDGATVHLVATGEVGARDVDLVINPRLGPSLRSMVPGDMLGRVLGTANQLLALPIVVTLKGPLPGFDVELHPAAPSVLQGSFSGLGELLMPEGSDLEPPPPTGS
ncbi:MAG: hypothetical protein JRH01_01915 [Deltaproteobacteria bacterium]|nr:hypothetical protein [Deltaproteobacteria bacterium]MBW2394820.1 hypothetical protein [Deltaproteobacteria bacterium]